MGQDVCVQCVCVCGVRDVVGGVCVCTVCVCTRCVGFSKRCVACAVRMSWSGRAGGWRHEADFGTNQTPVLDKPAAGPGLRATEENQFWGK